MPYPLSKAQRKFQQIKAEEKKMATRRAIEERIAHQLRCRGFEVSSVVLKNIANRELSKYN